MPGRIQLVTAALVLGASTPVLFEPVETTRDLLIALGAMIVGTQTSEDLTCIAAGILVSDGFIGFWWAVLGCYLGLMLGDTGLYLLGRILGRRALEWKWLRRKVPERSLNRFRRAFEKKVFSLIVLSRFLFGSRVPIYFSAGMLGVPFPKFVLYLGFAAAIWTPALVGISALLGEPFLVWFEDHKVLAGFGLVGMVATLWLVLHKGIPLFTWEGRRRALGFWRRRLRWEFWPRLIFYPPVVLYVLWLVLKHRRGALFTAANPGMPCGGGFLMETKSEIFKGIGDVPELPPWKRIPEGEVGEREAAFEEFLDRDGVDFPVILKPDRGLRGRDVRKIESFPEAVDYFSHLSADVIAQDYEDGIEFGVFYFRYPEEDTGRLFSITEKQTIGVTGDGIHTLESRILADDRAVCMAPFFFREHEEALDLVLPEGEFYQLARVGSHCQGALFLDASDCITPELTGAIDRISRGYEGFYFGRYDIKVPSREDFRAGRNLRVLELNGVTAEATHIYHPGTPLRKGYRTLFEQWRIAFEIAERNVARGARPLTLGETLQLFFQYRQT